MQLTDTPFDRGTDTPFDQPTDAVSGWHTVARYDDYAAAQAAVDRLSDDGFPVAELSIVGSGLRLVERITGRLTKPKAALTGAAGGAWAGLFVGLLLGLFTTGTGWLAMLGVGLAIGAGWGALFGWFAHAATRGRRDFSAVRTIAARHYDLVATPAEADRARVMLGQAGLLPR
ncbi:MAG: hypothetical protein JO144_17170 [Actinobacteria bacterium]|nr:hypothetical protein [Actinomycetota bacterium]